MSQSDASFANCYVNEVLDFASCCHKLQKMSISSQTANDAIQNRRQRAVAVALPSLGAVARARARPRQRAAADAQPLLHTAPSRAAREFSPRRSETAESGESRSVRCRAPFSRRSRSRARSTTPARGCGRSASPSYRAVARGARVLAEAFGDSGERREPLGALSRCVVASSHRIIPRRCIAAFNRSRHCIAPDHIACNPESRVPPSFARALALVCCCACATLGLGGPAPDEPPHGELRRRR